MSLFLNIYYITGAFSAVIAALSYRNTRVNKKKKQSIKVIKEFQSRIYPQIYDLENNINNAKQHAYDKAKIRWCDKICNDFHWRDHKKIASLYLCHRSEESTLL